MRIGIWMCLSALLGASVTGGAEHDGAAVWNQATRLELIQRDGAAVGVALKSGGQTLGEITFGPNGGWKAKRQEIKRDGQTATLRFVGFETAGTGGTPKLARDSFIEFALHGDAPFPRVRFSIGSEAFDENAWQAALAPPAPLYYLVCRVASPKMFYLGGGLIPAPEFEPYPLTRQGVMSGNWSARWSYAAPMAALAVPAFGLWNPDAKLFVGYDFGVARRTDRSDKHIASAYCAGEGKHQGDVFCLVHPYQARWVDLTHPKTPSRVESHFELVYSRDLPSHADPNEFVLTRFVRDHADLLVPAPAMNDLMWIRDPGKVRVPPTIQRDSGANLIHKSGPHYLEGAFVERGALMLGTTFPADGVRKIYQQKNRA
ncbi:MAG: hypothetical protein FJ272_06475, partial [Planctomycetes bacterium]|nr:hypothetical protein [Planctomycetota bacterium]